MKIVTAAQMRAIEEAAFASGRATAMDLMGQAGRAVASAALRLLARPDEDSLDRAALVLVGPGNNGGDGLVAAQALRVAGLRDVAVWFYRREGIGRSPVAADLLERVRVVSDDRLADAVAEADLVIDALFGTGQRSKMADELAATLELVNARAREGAARPRTVAVDLPTGVDADSGAVGRVAFRADLTVTLGRPEHGLYLPPGMRYAGRVEVEDLGLGDDGVPEDAPRLIARADADARLPRREADAHKGDAGSLLIVGGSANYIGAPVLSANAALRAGAGLVTMALPRALVPIAAAQVSEATYIPLPEADWGVIGPGAAGELGPWLGRYTALQVGNGIGRHAETEGELARFFGIEGTGQRRELDPAVPVLFDADGLNWLSTVERWWEHLRDLRLVLTPHAGEMARLRQVERTAISADPWTAAREAARAWGQTVVHKGGHSVAATRYGGLWVAPLANPALAAAGSGDTLAGLIAGLLAQGLPPDDAAILGLYLGSRAGELASAAVGTLPLVAGDLPAYIGRAIQELEADR